MEKKVALVTGAAQGLGAAIIKEFARNNYDVIVHYHTSEREAKELEKFLKENYEINALTVKCDLTNEEEIQNMISQMIEKFHHIDVLVNNAAVEITSEFESKKKQDFMTVLDTNLIAPFLLSKYISKYMLENGYGKIVNMTSNNAIHKYDPSTLEYDASKAAIISLTHNLAIELAPNINVNAVAPGWIMTEKVKELNDSLDGMLEKEEKKNILIERFATPEEVAKLVCFLCTDDARSINNQVITIDGGTR